MKVHEFEKSKEIESHFSDKFLQFFNNRHKEFLIKPVLRHVPNKYKLAYKNAMDKYENFKSKYKGKRYNPDIDYYLLCENGTAYPVEIKFDTYWYTGNFFFERYSNKTYQTNGGPWKCQENKINVYINCFVSLKESLIKEVFYFRAKELVEFLSIHFNEHDLIPIKNKSHITQGFKINKNVLLKNVHPIFKEMAN